MTDADSGTVDALATEVAVQIIKSFDGVHEVSDGELEALREEVGPAELLLAFSAIVYALVRLIDDHPAQFTIRDDAYTKVFTSPSLLQGAVAALRAQDVREADLPTMAGALAAASVGTPPSDWRRSLGHVPDDELVAWARLAWFLVTFIDRNRQQPGLALDVIRETVDMVAEPGA